MKAPCVGMNRKNLLFLFHFGKIHLVFICIILYNSGVDNKKQQQRNEGINDIPKGAAFLYEESQ